MNWIYFNRDAKSREVENFSTAILYLRPYQYDENKEMLVGEKIVWLDILCMERMLSTTTFDEETRKKAQEMYFKNLDNKESNIVKRR